MTSTTPFDLPSQAFSKTGRETARSLGRGGLIRSLGLAVIAGLFASASSRADQLSPDTSFRAPAFAKLFPPEQALALPDGKYFLYFDPDTVTDQRTGAITKFLANGAVDPSFNFDRTYKFVHAAALSTGPGANGQIYVAAARYVYGVKQGEQVLRVNSDGSVDPSFTPASIGGPPFFVWGIAPQPDGRILVYGFFSSISGTSRPNLARLLADGTVDSTFVPPSISGGEVYSLAVQPDGQILVGGSFSNVNGSPNLGVTRLNQDGSRDSTFQPTGFTRGSSTARIRSFHVQNDGKIVMSGNFRITSTTRAPLVRLNATGAADTTFTTVVNVSTTSTGRDLVVQSDGKLVVAVSASVFRFESNGALDSSFHQPNVVDTTADPDGYPGTPVTLDVLSDGDLILGGIFTDVDPPSFPGTKAHYGVARLNSDGTVDPSLTSIHRTGNETAPSSFARLADGSTLIVFPDRIDPEIPYNFGRLLPNGSRDPNFTLSSSDPNRFLTGFTARGVEALPDGNLFVYGIGADLGPSYGKVQPSGAEVTTFATNRSAVFQKATVAPDGKIMGAAGTDVQITVFNSFNRLLADGQVDSSFGNSFIHDAQVIRNPFNNNLIESMFVGSRVLAVQPDGKVLVQYFAQDNLIHFVRLDTDGSFDGSFAENTYHPSDVVLDFPVIFDPQTGATYQPIFGVQTPGSVVLDAYVQPDGRIIVTGHFTSFGSTSAHGIARLQSNGSIDNTFNVGGGAQWTATAENGNFFPGVENVEPQADGKFLITGTFEAFNGVAAPGIASLNPDGSVDSSFVAPAGRDKYSRVASALARQPDGSFLLSGPHTFPNETGSPSLIRLVGGLVPVVGNVSTRLAVGADDNALIEGFIVQGPAGSSKKILVRAIGPSLAQFGVPDALANPTLEIHDASGATVATNNDWRTTQVGGLITGNQFVEINGSGLAPGSDLESAIIVSLEPGSYTAVVRGAGNTAGTGVVDAFDLASGSAARLANIATRGLVQPGDGLMIGGFIVQNGPLEVVVRAIGPSLVQFGIPNALPDTTLQLRDQQGAIVLENDDWRSSQEQELISLGLQPSDNLEAALVSTIQPGQYTAQVRGKGQASGIGVVQVYFIP